MFLANTWLESDMKKTKDNRVGKKAARPFIKDIAQPAGGRDSGYAVYIDKDRGGSGGGDWRGGTYSCQKYYQDNWDLLKNQPDVRSAVMQNLGAMMCKGICIMDGGNVMKPEGAFRALVDECIIPALEHAYFWLLCFGLVVWCRTTWNGRPYLFVPPPSAVDVRFETDKTTGVVAVHVNWISKEVDSSVSALYVYRTAPCTIFDTAASSIIDGIAPLVDNLANYEMYRAVVLRRVALPSVIVQESASGSGIVEPNIDVPSLSRHDQARLMTATQLARADQLHFDRINAAINTANALSAEDALAMRDQMNVPPGVRIEAMIAEPVENRFVGVAPGMTAAALNAPVHDLDYNESITNVISRISAILGRSIDGTVAITPIQELTMATLGKVATAFVDSLYPGSGVQVFLMSYILADRDMAAPLVAQGVISEETYLALHPPVTDEQKKDTTNKKTNT